MFILGILFIIWFVGYIIAIYPIHAALMRTHTANVESHNKGRMDSYGATGLRQVTPGDAILSIIGASLLGIVWFLAIPYYISHMIMNRHKPSLEREIEAFADEYKYKTELKKRMANAHKELETEFK
jgi:hypothetical protein